MGILPEGHDEEHRTRDYYSTGDLIDLDLDPAALPPTDLVGLDGGPCWSLEQVEHLLRRGGA